MHKVLIIGAGGVGGVVAHKCAANPDVFGEILLASRTLEKCERIATEVKQLRGREIATARLDADDVAETVGLINDYGPALVINVALPYQDLPIMDACLETGVDYLDTANYEPKDTAKFEYSWQWAYRDRFRDAGIMALLGSGFDPGMTNVYCAYARDHLFDEIETIDILDCNGGDHGKAFATNFNPEINIREITQNGPLLGETASGSRSTPCPRAACSTSPSVGERKAFLLYHEELESLVAAHPRPASASAFG